MIMPYKPILEAFVFGFITVLLLSIIWLTIDYFRLKKKRTEEIK